MIFKLIIVRYYKNKVRHIKKYLIEFELIFRFASTLVRVLDRRLNKKIVAEVTLLLDVKNLNLRIINVENFYYDV